MARKKTPSPIPVHTELLNGAETRLWNWKQGNQVSNVAHVRGRVSPLLTGLGDRSTLPANTWRSFSERTVSREDMNDAAKVLDPKSTEEKMRTRADYVGTYKGYRGILKPEYDMLEPFVLLDTEAYLKQGINRKLALMLRQGFAITSDDETAGETYADYVKKRLTTMEYVTGRSAINFFRDILLNLSLCSNCFLLKIRDQDGSGGIKKKENDNKEPVAGYQIIPAHTLFPYMDKGVITKWRRYYDTGLPYEDYTLDEILHFKWDVKPGHIFGTPRTIAVRDDIFALRRLEENIELLFINHLFPLFHVKIGDDEHPCTYLPDGTSEIDLVRQQIETMPKEGVFVTDDRVTVEAVGAKGESLDTKELVMHLKGRVFSGLGMSAIDMGEGDTANRSTADSISQVLKDSIKADLDMFGSQVRMLVFKEWFREAPISISIQKAVATTRVEWHEIDTDGRIKEENHAMTMYTNNMVTRTEGRSRAKMKPMKKEDEKDTHYERHVKDLETHTAKLNAQENEKQHERDKEMATHETKQMAKQAETTMALHKSEVEKDHGKAKAAHVKASAQVKVLKAKTEHAKVAGVKGNTVSSKKTAKNRKTVQNRNTPTNQHGSNTSPHKARSSREVMNLIYDRLVGAYELADGPGEEEWCHLSASAIEGVIRELEAEEISSPDENSYTRQVRTGAMRLKELAAATPDLELLRILLDAEIEDEDLDLDEEDDNAGDTEVESSATDRDPTADELADDTVGAGAGPGEEPA